MKVLYVCDFDLSRTSGKDRATRQKLQALGELCELTVLSSKTSSGYAKPFELILIELRALLCLVFFRPEVVISRGYVGWFFQKCARWRGVITVREIHSDVRGELHLLPYKGVKLLLIKAIGQMAFLIDRAALLRIFNHPDLKNWYAENVKYNQYDSYVYNGCDLKSNAALDRDSALKLFSLDPRFHYLVFTGGASKWHGVEYLVDLQLEFNKHRDDVKIVCGGGAIKDYDPNNICINITPLDERGCANLMKAGSLCLLPVKSNRISPGSPLKLYDYIANKRFVVAPLGVCGYSDEVLSFGVGLCVDFTDPVNARIKILEFITSRDLFDETTYPACPVGWSDRMKLWLSTIERLKA